MHQELNQTVNNSGDHQQYMRHPQSAYNTNVSQQQMRKASAFSNNDHQSIGGGGHTTQKKPNSKIIRQKHHMMMNRQNLSRGPNNSNFNSIAYNEGHNQSAISSAIFTGFPSHNNSLNISGHLDKSPFKVAGQTTNHTNSHFVHQSIDQTANQKQRPESRQYMHPFWTPADQAIYQQRPTTAFTITGGYDESYQQTPSQLLSNSKMAPVAAMSSIQTPNRGKVSSENIHDDTQMKAQQPNHLCFPSQIEDVSGFTDQEMVSYHSSSKKPSTAPEDKENVNLHSNSGKQKNKHSNKSVIRLIQEQKNQSLKNLHEHSLNNTINQIHKSLLKKQSSGVSSPQVMMRANTSKHPIGVGAGFVPIKLPVNVAQKPVIKQKPNTSNELLSRILSNSENKSGPIKPTVIMPKLNENKVDHQQNHINSQNFFSGIADIKIDQSDFTKFNCTRKEQSTAEKFQQMILGDINSSAGKNYQSVDTQSADSTAKVIYQRDQKEETDEHTMSDLEQEQDQAERTGLGNPIFVKENVWTQKEDDGPPENGALQPAILRNQHSETMHSIPESSKNEQTNSSLGKRNYNEFQKTHSKENLKIVKEKTSADKKELEQIDEKESIDQRIKKTPARKIKKGIPRNNSDNFDVVVHQSAKKTLINPEHETDCNLATLNQFFPMKSDAIMSSQGDPDGTLENPISQGPMHQKMGYNGQQNQMYYFNNMNLMMTKQFSCNGSTFDNQIVQQDTAPNPADFSENDNQKQRMQDFKALFMHQAIQQLPQGKGTPNFIKQQLNTKDAFYYHTMVQEQENRDQVINDDEDETENMSEVKKENQVISEESEEGQFERDGDEVEEPSTNIQTETMQKQPRWVPEFYQQAYNFQDQHPLLAEHGFNFPVHQKSSMVGMNNYHQNVIKQLSFKSQVSSLIDETPQQQKRQRQNSHMTSSMISQGPGLQIFNQAPHMYFGDIPANQTEMAVNLQPMLQKSMTTKEDGSPQSLVLRFRQQDPIFQNRYSSGATPPQKRASKASSSCLMLAADNDGYAMQKSKSHIITRPVVYQAKNKFGNTMSPNDLKQIGSDSQNELTGERKPFLFDSKTQVKQRLQFEDPSNEEGLNNFRNLGKQHSVSCLNVLTQTQTNAVHMPSSIPSAYQQNNFFQTVNEKKQQEKLIVLSPEIMHKSNSNQHQKESSSNITNGLQIRQGLGIQNIVAEPFSIAHGIGNNNFMRTHLSTSLSNSMSLPTGQKSRPTVNTQIQDGKSNGGPKTPVHNPHGLFRNPSLISGTNTSMNEASVLSSQPDTDNYDYPYNKKNKRPKFNNFMVNQFNYGGALTAPQNVQTAAPLHGIKSTLFQAPVSNNGSMPISKQNSFNQATFAMRQSNQLTPTKKVSWLEQEFTQISQLGKGHFGKVIKCQNNTDKFEYAIKITYTKIRSPSEQAYYLQEMQTLSALSVESECPHIVRYFNSWIENERIHIVMELCEKSLKEVKIEAKHEMKRLQRISSNSENDRWKGHIPEENMRQIIRDILLGLSEIHRLDIVHLDIKPGNILLGKNGNYKLGDLGMARFLTKITEEKNIPEGDCRYLASELLSREVLAFLPDLKKSDIFSLGITAYEMLTLKELEKNGPEWRSLRDGTFEYPQFVEKIYSQELLEVIRCMLSEHTENRPSADQLLNSVFKSPEQRTITHLQHENAILFQQQNQLVEFLRQQGLLESFKQFILSQQQNE